MSDDNDSGFMPNNPIYGGLEKFLERQLDASSAARSAARKLENRVLALEITGIGVNTYLRCASNKIKISSDYDDEPEVIISGSPLALLNFARSNDQGAFRGGGITFTGDIGVAQEFQKLFALLSPDLEEELSRFVGDEAAHQVGSLAKDLFGLGNRIVDTVSDGIGQVLAKSPAGNATEQELEAFYDEVDRIRAEVDRTEARFEQLLNRQDQS